MKFKSSSVLRIVTLMMLLTLTSPMFAQVSIAKFKDGCKGALSFTFDDGLEEHYTIVFPEMNKRSIKGTFAIVGRNVDGSNKYGPCVTWEQLREMGHSGHELSSHGWAHRTLTKLSLDEMEREVNINDSIILFKTGKRPLTYVYPGNRTNDTITEYVGRNRICTRTSQFSLGSKRTPEWFAKKIRNLIDNGEWGVSMTHGITYGYDAFGSVEAFTTMLDIACSERDNLWIAPLAEVGAYVKERDNTHLEIEDNGVALFITPKMNISPELFKQPLTLIIKKGETGKIISAQQNNETLQIMETDSCYMLNFMPSAGVITCNYK